MANPGYFEFNSAPSSRASSLRAPRQHLSDLSPATSNFSDPFVDPRLSLDSRSTGDPFGGGGGGSYTSGSRDSSHSRERPPMPPSRPSEVQRQLQGALEDELDVDEVGSRTPVAEVPPGRRVASNSSSSSAGKSKDGFWAQFQSGELSLYAGSVLG